MYKLLIIAVALSITACCPERGPRGLTGATGASGNSGVPGIDGHSSLVKVLSASASVCSSGGSVLSFGSDTNDNGVLDDSEITSATSVCNGSVGQTGNTGAAGSNGINGTNGTNATPVTMVKLCPNTDHYPNVFVEYAMCVNNNLYAVYSIPNAFMTLLTPGAYSSAGIGSSCNLTVGTNCQVTH